MSVQDEAARVIGNVHADPMQSSRPLVAAQALDAAGLLAPEDYGPQGSHLQGGSR